MANIYDVGQLVRISVTFTVQGEDTDPTAQLLEVTAPDGTTYRGNQWTTDDVNDSA